ncbi:putative disease resistance protein RGA3 [Impatiens glandulifera]|uniref:putative disease resistance protein RGA3 n=1 Tax=Impatiens glandulifera TaxID=253017 RepID=UPI001FB177FE|nr:putative disease resistance protein RGA3 [Impatiens glandulifera]
MVDAALISGLLSNLAPLIKDEFSVFWNFKREVQNLSSTLSAINAVLEDAERKILREKDKQTEDWLRKLKNVLYEVRGIMDECTFEDLRLQVNKRNASSSTQIQVTNLITHPFSTTKMRHKIGHKIKDVQEKLDQISSERQKLHLHESINDSKIVKFTSSWRETMSLSSSRKVYGRDKEKKEIIDILLNKSSACVATELSVLPIVGMGGLGKTTLAQMVFNDNKVSKHFDTKFWVCVSDEFDIKLVIKSILEEKGEACLQELQKKVRDKLKGRRYLIVLDDVWNENVEAWDQLRSILDCESNGAFIITTTRKRNVAKIMETIQHFELSSLSEDDCWLLFEERAFEHGKPKHPNLINIGKEIARKCKGVPLVAKTLGSQLGFSEDEKEWCRIRDSEIWEISENEKSIMPILRLSYYDLPYHLRRCFVFCAIFPKDTKIMKEILIQLWMAHDLIPPVKKQEVEDVGNIIWKELCWRSFFQDEKENTYGYDRVYTTCNMHDLIHDLAQSVMIDECYTMNAKKSSDGLGREIHHVTIMIDQLDKTSVKTVVCSLKKIGGLQSIMLDGRDDDGNVTKEILNVLEKLPLLRVLEVRRHLKFKYIPHVQLAHEDLRYVGCLKHLKYLDISFSLITTLPNSICDLLNLRTLKLESCYNLESLPRNTKDLISLRHLYLEGCDGLKYMPRGMGQLKQLKTLSLFVISEKIDHCQLDELKELDIGGSLRIKNLERVSDVSIARGISMAKMLNISNLELNWGFIYAFDADGQEKIGELLEVSTGRLKILKMRGYKGVNLPKWVAKSYPSLICLELNGLDNVSTIASSSHANEMIVVFPLLEKLVIDEMKNLSELVPGSCWSPGAFPNLHTLKISYCPKLGALPPHLKSLKDVTVKGECSNELFYSISNLSALTKLHLYKMDERSVLFGAGYMFANDEMPSSSSSSSNNNNEAQLGGGGVRSTFQSLQSLNIWWCKKLRRLFDSGMIMEEEKQQKHHHHLQAGQTERTRGLMNSLTELHIRNCPELMISVEEFGNLNSLQSLTIENCPKLLVSSEEADDVMAFLRSLRTRLDPGNFYTDFIIKE